MYGSSGAVGDLGGLCWLAGIERGAYVPTCTAQFRLQYLCFVCRHEDIQGDYSELMSSSVFCLVLPGDGWSARMDDATLHG